jgi:hypothetical protein
MPEEACGNPSQQLPTRRLLDNSAVKLARSCDISSRQFRANFDVSQITYVPFV